MQRLRQQHRQLSLCVMGDDLYAHEPFVQDLRELRMGFVLVAKPASHVELFDWVEDLDQLGECVRGKWEEGPACKRRFFEYRIAHQVPLTQSEEVLVNFVEAWERNKEDKVVYHNSWVTDFEMRPENAATIIGIGRSRWKIENEQFNVQKNHGYELEHNYGHGQETHSMVFYLLNLLAFLAHQVLEFGDRLYQQCRAGESRSGLWNVLRTLFGYLRDGRKLGGTAAVSFERGRESINRLHAQAGAISVGRLINHRIIPGSLSALITYGRELLGDNAFCYAGRIF